MTTPNKLPTPMRSDSSTCSDEFSAREVSWYRANGKYSKRITQTYGGAGSEYVIGDHDWNRKHPKNQEWIEAKMKHQLGNQNVKRSRQP